MLLCMIMINKISQIFSTSGPAWGQMPPSWSGDPRQFRYQYQDINRTLINLNPSDGLIASEIIAVIGHDPDICYYHPHAPRHLSVARAYAQSHREAVHHGPRTRGGRPRCRGGHLPLGDGRGWRRSRRGGWVEHGEVRGEGGHLVPDGGGKWGRGLGLWRCRGLWAEGEHRDRGEVVQWDPHLQEKECRIRHTRGCDAIGVLNNSLEKKKFLASFENLI